MTLPGLITKGISQRTVPAEVYTPVPVTVRRALPIGGNVQKCKELPACVVENSVNHHFDVDVYKRQVLRIHCGLEGAEVLKADLENALSCV